MQIQRLKLEREILIYLFGFAAVGDHSRLICCDIENILVVAFAQQLEKPLSFLAAVTPTHESDVSRFTVIASPDARVLEHDKPEP